MPDYPLQDIESIKYPKRRPWLVIVVVLAVGALVFWFQSRPPSQPKKSAGGAEVPATAPAASPTGIQTESGPSAAPAPERAGATVSTPVSAAAPNAAASVGVPKLLQDARAAEARETQDASALAEARKLYLAVLAQNLSPATRSEVEGRLGRVNVSLALTPLPLPGLKVDYVVKSGDSIDRIAKRLGTTTRLIERSNQVSNPNRIKAGDRFRILTGKFAIAVNKTTKDLLVTLNGEYFKRYGVGTGKFGKTPTGEFEIYDKITEPTWWRSDGKEVPFGNPENILGTRWMAIRAVSNTPDVRGYGIHGTWDDTSIGKAESAGCVRMRNPEVEELFDLVPVGTRVVIVE